MRLCVLRSGSSGNCTYIEHEKTKILLDAGGHSQIGLRSLLAEIGIGPESITAVVTSHLHSDHLNESALSLFGKCKVPIWVHEDNLPVLHRSLGKKKSTAIALRGFGDRPFQIGEMEFQPFPVDHDARDRTSGFKFRAMTGDRLWVSFATDLGCFPDSLIEYFAGSAVIILEANHDSALLWANPRRPYFHKQRVASDTGHLSNDQAAKALVKICAHSPRRPSYIILSHLSKDHNSPEMALEHIGKQLGESGVTVNLVCALRDRRTEFIEVG